MPGELIVDYNRDKLLKAANVPISFTREQVDEYLKCVADPVYFAKNYCRIVTLDGGIQKFAPYPYQESILHQFADERKVVTMMGRQQGKTTSVAVFILWYTLFHPQMYVAITANKSKQARQVLDRYQQMYKQLPRWLQQGVTTWNKGDIALENGSVVVTSATTSDGVRGASCVAGDTRVCVENNGAIFYCTLDQARALDKPAYVQSNNTRMLYCVFETKIHGSKSAGVLGVYGTVEECILSNINPHGSCFVDGYLGDGVRLLTMVERARPHNMEQRILGVFDNEDASLRFMDTMEKELNAHPDR